MITLNYTGKNRRLSAGKIIRLVLPARYFQSVSLVMRVIPRLQKHSGPTLAMFCLIREGFVSRKTINWAALWITSIWCCQLAPVKTLKLYIRRQKNHIFISHGGYRQVDHLWGCFPFLVVNIRRIWILPWLFDPFILIYLSVCVLFQH